MGGNTGKKHRRKKRRNSRKTFNYVDPLYASMEEYIGGCGEVEGDNPDETTYTHRNVAPLLHICSLTIHTNQTSEGVDECQIYGCVSVVDMSGDSFHLFLRERDEPECIANGGSLLLSHPSLDSNGSANVIIPSHYVCLRVHLFDKARDDVLISQGEFSLDRLPLDCRQQQICEPVPGYGGLAKVHFVVFPFAVLAAIDVIYLSKHDDHFDPITEEVQSTLGTESCDLLDRVDYSNQIYGNNVAAVFGTVTAGSYSLDTADCYASVLFSKTPEQAVEVKSGGFITLSRSIVAVPAHSSLKIEVNLSDRNTQLPIGTKTVEFIPQHRRAYKKDIGGEIGRIRVRVKWNDAYQQLNSIRARKMQQSDHEYAVTPDIGDGLENQMSKLLLGQQSPENYFCSSRMPSAMVEVFSVVVCNKEFRPFNFYGTIAVNSLKSPIFKKYSHCPQHCPPFGTQLELSCHKSFDLKGSSFTLWVVCKDVNGSSISYGFIEWSPHQILERRDLMDKRLCSIIRGDEGFAAVYYAIFPDPLAAEVTIKLNGITPSDRVSGKIVARHSCHDYASSYDKMYYQSVIFHKDAEEGLTLDMPGCCIPLLKSVVAAPRNSVLTFQVDLAVDLPQKVLSLKENITFEVKDGCFQRICAQSDVQIEVSLKFRLWEWGFLLD